MTDKQNIGWSRQDEEKDFGSKWNQYDLTTQENDLHTKQLLDSAKDRNHEGIVDWYIPYL